MRMLSIRTSRGGVNRQRRTLLGAAIATAPAVLLAAPLRDALAAADASAAPADGEITVQRQYVNGPYGQMHLRTWAPADPARATATPLLCLHPTPFSGAFFDEFAAQLATDRIVLCPDTPGYGGSSRPPAPVSVADYAGAIASLLRATGYGRGGRGGVDVLGFHTGAAIAAELGINYPDLAQRLVLAGLPYFADPEEQRAELETHAREKPYTREPERLGDAWLDYYRRHADRAGRGRLQALFAEQLRAGDEAWWAYRAVFTWPGGERLARIRQQVLLIATGETLFRHTVDALPLLADAELVEHPEFGAPVFQHHHEAMAGVVRGWTAQLCRC